MAHFGVFSGVDLVKELFVTLIDFAQGGLEDGGCWGDNFPGLV